MSKKLFGNLLKMSKNVKKNILKMSKKLKFLKISEKNKAKKNHLKKYLQGTCEM